MDIVGNLVILAISWFLLRLEHKSLQNALGLNLSIYRLLQFMVGFLATVTLAVLVHYTYAVAANFTWVLRANISPYTLVLNVYAALSLVLLQELLFRGYLLYQGIGLLGERSANFISAAAFGMYHWFILGVFGNPFLMVWVLLTTGIWGLMFAYAFSKTHSLALPVGLHFGWAFVDKYILSDSGQSLLVPVTSIHSRYPNTIESIMYLHLPKIAFAVLVIILLIKSRSLVSSRPKYK